MPDESMGDFPPYYFMSNDTLYEIPTDHIVRDYNFGISSGFRDFCHNFVQTGKTLRFSSRDMIQQDALSSKAIIVVSDRAERYGGTPSYTWFIRVVLKVPLPGSAISKANPSDVLRFGSKILWPIDPKRARLAYDRWNSSGSETVTRLGKRFRPSNNEFDISFIFGATQVEFCKLTTIRAIQCVRPIKEDFLQIDDAAVGDARAEQQDTGRIQIVFKHDVEADEQASAHSFRTPRPCRSHDETIREPLFASSIVSHQLTVRAQRLFPMLRFSASRQSGWNVLSSDLQYYIFRMIADEVVNSHGGRESESFQAWLLLRLVCQESRDACNESVFDFMKTASDAVALSYESLCIADALRVRNLLVPRRIHAYKFHLEMEKAARHSQSNVYASIWPWVRLRTGKCMTKPTPSKNNRLLFRGPSPEPVDAKPPLDPSIRRSARLQGSAPCGDPGEDEGCAYDVVHVQLRVAGERTTKATRDAEASPTMLANSGTRSAVPPPPLPQPQPPDPPHPPSGSYSPATNDWVQCSCCMQRRPLPSPNSRAVCDGLFDSLSLRELPLNWTCSDHPLGIYECDSSSSSLHSVRRSKRMRS